MLAHIHMPVGLETNTLSFKQGSLATPARSRSPFFVHYTMTGQRLCSRRISECATYHPRMARPTRQSRDISIGRHPSARYLADDIQHGITKSPCLLWCHLVGIVVHTLYGHPILSLLFWHLFDSITKHRTGHFVGMLTEKLS